MFINSFEGSCGTFGEGKKSIVINDIGLVCSKKKTYLKKKETTIMGWMLA
jgi:hypothetical protein